MLHYLNVFVFCVLLLNFNSASAQSSFPLKNEIGITPFAIEANSETINDNAETKFFQGIYYNRFINNSNWSWVVNIDYGENILNDDCKSCNDAIYGRGQMIEFNASAGMRFTFFHKQQLLIKPFLEFGPYYSYIHYSGNFSGGIGGSGLNFDNEYNTAGIEGTAGIVLFPHYRFPITLSSGLRTGWSKRPSGYHGEKPPVTSWSATMINIGLGYRF